MKKLLPLFCILVIVIALAACNSKPQADVSNEKIMTPADTIGLAEFQKWKTQNELKDPTVYYQQGNETVVSQPAKGIKRSYSPIRKSPVSNSMNSVAQYPAKTSVKKGWSRKAKGAVIGGGGGAIIGALVNKNNRLVGGALGGALGAGLGYVIGNELDKKHGR